MKWNKSSPWLLWTLAGVALVAIVISLALTNHQTSPTNAEQFNLVPVTGQPFTNIHLPQPKFRGIRGNFYVILNGFDGFKNSLKPSDTQPRHLYIYPPNVK